MCAWNRAWPEDRGTVSSNSWTEPSVEDQLMTKGYDSFPTRQMYGTADPVSVSVLADRLRKEDNYCTP